MTDVTANAIPFATTTVDPAGKFKKCATTVPKQKQASETTAAVITTLLKLLHTRIAVSAGKITNAVISNVPIIRIPSTTVTAVVAAMTVLYTVTGIPPA